MCNEGLYGLSLPPALKEGAPRLSYQLPQMWAQREVGGVSFKSSSPSNIQEWNQIYYRNQPESSQCSNLEHFEQENK